MQVCRVIGSVVSTIKAEKLSGKKLLVVQPVNMRTIEQTGNPIVAVDAVGSGEGEIVMIVSGSSARQTEVTNGAPVDATIVGIIDYIDIEGKVTFDKQKGGVNVGNN